MKRIGLAFFVVVSIGASLVGLAAIDRSALPSWVPRRFVESIPDGSVVRSWMAPSWHKTEARAGIASSRVPALVSNAELKDYEFQLVRPEIKAGSGVEVAVRLVHKPSGRSVPDAVVFARRIDMAPDGMPTMTAPLDSESPSEPGTYRFKTNLVMEGGWQLSLAAKVQGENGTIQNRLVLKAVP